MKKWYVLVSLSMVFTIQGMDRQICRSENPFDTFSGHPMRGDERLKECLRTMGTFIDVATMHIDKSVDERIELLEKQLERQIAVEEQVVSKSAADQEFFKSCKDLLACVKARKSQVGQATPTFQESILKALKEPDVYGSFVVMGLHAAKYYECIPDKVFFPAVAAAHGFVAFHVFRDSSELKHVVTTRRLFGFMHAVAGLGYLCQALKK